MYRKFAMEPIITIEGYEALQSQQKSRDLLNSFYRSQGYEIITPKSALPAKEEKATTTGKEQQQSSTSNGK